MRYIKNPSRLVIFLIPLLSLLPSLSIAGQFTITRVYDGDTVEAQGYDVEIKVRLVGIDAPEKSLGKHSEGQPFSQQAGK